MANIKHTINKKELEIAVINAKSIYGVMKILNLPYTGSLHYRIKNEIKKYNFDNSHFTGQNWNKGSTRHSDNRVQGFSKEQIFVEHSIVSTTVVRKFLETLPSFIHKCEICNNTEWCGQKIPLELDHINGNNRDNRIENLRFICLNCHAQTHSFRGRNINKKKIKVSEEEMINAIKTCKCIREVLIKVGLTPKGGNYTRVQEIMAIHNLNFEKTKP